MTSQADTTRGMRASAATRADGPTPWPQIENPVTGERMVVLGGISPGHAERLEVQFDLPPGAAGSPLHYHRRMHETFEVSSGSLQMTVGRTVRAIQPGEIVIVPPRTPHAFCNASSEWVTFSSTITPPGQFERFLRAWYGLARAGRVDATGMPRSPLFLALGLEYADLAIPGVPDVLQRILVRSVTGIARLVGAESRLDMLLASNQPLA